MNPLLLILLGGIGYLIYTKGNVFGSAKPTLEQQQQIAAQFLKSGDVAGYQAYLEKAQQQACPANDPNLNAYRAFLDSITATNPGTIANNDPRLIAWLANYEKNSDSSCVNPMSQIAQEYTKSGKLAPWNQSFAPPVTMVGMNGGRR